MNTEGLVEAVSAGLASSLATGGAVRRYWGRREDRQRAAFRRDVQDIVDESIGDVIRRQAEFERRQRDHLNRQDKAISDLRSLIQRGKTR